MSNLPIIENLQQNLDQKSQSNLLNNNQNNHNEQIIYPVNFCQSENWAKFWVKISGKPHKIVVFENNIQIYIYPWQFGQFFAYIPKLHLQNIQEWRNLLNFVANCSKKKKLENNLETDLEKDSETCQKIENLVFLKVDFDISSLSTICPELSQEVANWQSQDPELYTFAIDQKLAQTNQKILQSLQKSLLKKWENGNENLEQNSNEKTIKNWANSQDKFYKIQISTKKIQYLQSTTIVLANLFEQKANLPKTNLENLDLEGKIILDLENNLHNLDNPNFQALNNFYEKSQELWVSFSPRIRRYTRKILKELEQKKFEITIEKTQKTWQDFYNVHIQTAQRQNFPTQNEKYLRELFWQEFTRIIIIRDKKGEVESVFLGILQDNSKSLVTKNQVNQRVNPQKLETLQNNSQQNLNLSNLSENSTKRPKNQKIFTYLLGGNSQAGLTNNVQYLLQLSALWLCAKENCQFYDMGGWEFGTGYSEFKNGYRGNLQTFFGPFDFVLKPKQYNLTNFAINFAKKIRNLGK